MVVVIGVGWVLAIGFDFEEGVGKGGGNGFVVRV